MILPTIRLSDVATRPKAPLKDLPPRKLLKQVPDTDDYILEMDNSSLETFTTCPRLAKWKLIYSRSSYPRYALTYGKFIHKALESFYTARLHSKAWFLSDTLLEGERDFVENPPDTNEWRTYEKFSETITKYSIQYKTEDFDILAVEQPFATPLCDIKLNQYLPYPKSLLVADTPSSDDESHRFYVGIIHVSWTGVIDLIIKHLEDYWIVDHKTTSIEGDTFWRTFELSQQFLGYAWSAQQITGFTIKGALANVIYGRRPTKTGRNLDLLRRYYHYKPEHINEWHTNIVSIIKEFINNLVSDNFPMKTVWCVNKFGLCDFHDVCSVRPDLRLQLLMSNQYTTNIWNPLDQ